MALGACEGSRPPPAGDAATAVPPADPCTQTALTDPTTFPPCGLGAGVFGRWIVDGFGLPAYEYDDDESADPRAAYPNSLDDDRRTHWHQLGNDRVTAAVFNDGYVELLGQDRGPTWYNRFAPSQQNYAGGFGFVADERGGAWTTAFAYRPPGARTRRVFGLGYAEAVTEHDGLRVTRRTYAPPGDASMLVVDVTLESIDQAVHHTQYYEYWDVNRHQLEFELLRTGRLGQAGDDQRDQLNAPFTQSVSFDAPTSTLRATLTWASGAPPIAESAVSPVDDYPSDVFLSALVGTVADTYTDQAKFFGTGDPARPDTVATSRAGELLTGAPAVGQPAALVLRSDVSVSRSGPMHLRYAYGYTRPGADTGIPDAFRDPAHDVLGDTLSWWRGRLAYFASTTDPALHREVAWRSYYLQSASGHLDYFQTRTVAQGSAYLYLHGFDGAPRDQALFAMPLVYVNPALARDLLTLIMELTQAADGSISYSYHGYGVLESAGIHGKSSDLDIAFLMALSEYLAATGDRAWLGAHVPFYPAGAPNPPGAQGTTVLDHARAAYRHLVDVIGVGDHGLVKIGTGDWNDGITLTLGAGAAHDNSVTSGESHPNTAMAAFVLPVAAAILEREDAGLAAAMRATAQSYLSALRAEWAGQWYPRAYLRDDQNNVVRIGDASGFLWLETQPWALLASAPTNDQATSLLESIDTRLDGPSPIGAMIQEPVPGNEDGAQVWPAITGILTWAYAHVRPDLAWRSVVRNTLYAHAEAYPSIWYGIWSLPDGVNGPTSTQAGYTWSSPATPMTDFPVMNANPDAMGLLGVLRVAGLEPAVDGLLVHPVVPGPAFVLDVPLIRLEVGAGYVRGEYRAANDGAVVLHVAVPSGAHVMDARIRGASFTPVMSGGDVLLPLSFPSGDRVSFEVDTQ